MTKKEAKELAIKKWQYIVNNNGSDIGIEIECPELEEFRSNCSYCEKYMDTFNKIFDFCAKCPINLPESKYENFNTPGCLQYAHPFYKWFLDPTEVNAQKVLYLILKS